MPPKRNSTTTVVNQVKCVCWFDSHMWRPFMEIHGEFIHDIFILCLWHIDDSYYSIDLIVSWIRISNVIRFLRKNLLFLDTEFLIQLFASGFEVFSSFRIHLN